MVRWFFRRLDKKIENYVRGGQMKNSRFVKIGLLILILVFAIGLSLWIGIDFAIRTLILVMCVDYVLGLSLAISDKSKHGDGGLVI